MHNKHCSIPNKRNKNETKLPISDNVEVFTINRIHNDDPMFHGQKSLCTFHYKFQMHSTKCLILGKKISRE